MDRLYLLAPVYGGLIIGCKSSLAGEERDEKERERERERRGRLEGDNLRV